MHHASETWASNHHDSYLPQRNDGIMIRWMRCVTAKDQISSQDILERMQLGDLAKVLLTRRLRGHGHVERSAGLPSAGFNWDPPFRQESLDW